MISPRTSCVLFGLLAANFSLFAQSSPSAPQVVSSTAAPVERTHRIFLGAEIKVKDDAGWHRVDGAERGWFVSHEAGVPVRIPMDRPGFEFSYDRTLKVTAQEVDVLNLKTEGAYSPNRDPGRRWVADQSMAMASSSQDVDVATNVLRIRLDNQAQYEASVNALAAGGPVSVEDIVGDSPGVDVDGAAMAASSAVTAAGAGRYQTDYGDRNRGDPDGTGEPFDALRVSATLQSPVDLDDPHVVVFVGYSLPEEVRQRRRVFAEPIQPIKAGEVRRLSFQKNGFPVGFEIDFMDLHFFNDGLEISTPGAARRTALTWDEAVEFAVIDHVSRARDTETAAAASVVREIMTPSQQEAWAEQGRPCFVRVSTEGRAIAVYADAAGKHPLEDPMIQTMVGDLGFRPAVSAAGEPYESVIALDPVTVARSGR